MRLCRRLGWGFNRRPRAILPDCRQPETQSGGRRRRKTYLKNCFKEVLVIYRAFRGTLSFFGGVLMFLVQTHKWSRHIQMFPAAEYFSGIIFYLDNRATFLKVKASVCTPTSRRSSIPRAYSLRACSTAEGMDGLLGADQGARGVRGPHLIQKWRLLTFLLEKSKPPVKNRDWVL